MNFWLLALNHTTSLRQSKYPFKSISYKVNFISTVRLVADTRNTFSLQLEGLFGGFLDGVAVWVREVRRPRTEQSPPIIELEQSRALRCLGHFEKLSDKLDQQPKLAHIMLGCTLGIIEARLQKFQWRQKHLRLAKWYDEFSSRSSMQATKPEV